MMLLIICSIQNLGGGYAHYEAPILIGDDVMIGADSIILPNVMIGNEVVVGAGSVVVNDIESHSVSVGIPCKKIGTFDEFCNKRRLITNKNCNELWEEFVERRKM